MNDGQSLVSSKPKRKIWKRVLISLSALVVVLVVGLTITYQAMKYEPLEEAKQAMQSNSTAKVSTVKDGFRFEPADGNVVQPSVIFYPGGLVDAESYAPLARKLAEAGHRVYIAEMPFDLAIFGQNKAKELIAEHPEDTYVIGGHSLGGVFASRYAAENTDKISGVFFLGSYADEGGSLKDSSLNVLQITASKDAVLNWTSWEESKQNLPADSTVYVTIEGGNHGQFGTYGMQKGDNVADILPEQQLEEVSSAIINWLPTVQK
ncbi:dienelactone hydrolase [Paenibacillus anaericanus]|uniref:alpha/beta hydrolase n=1 Tax=Paenibacillus anaericanus TaxID=170367 RepID=UPI00278A303D|nr:alpha/beta hydrolase [Paenibacillus anaericanus]MDQ0090393.1 dienelactone hydrolase [Paenibacillus anaericanus]